MRRRIEIQDAVVLAVGGLSVAAVSFMLYIRLRAAGAPKRATLLLVIEMWASFGLAVFMFAALGGLLGGSSAESWEEEAPEVIARFGSLSRQNRVLFGGGLLVSVGLFAHLLVIIRNRIRDYPL